MNCNSDPACMFYNSKRTGCSRKNIHLVSLSGCEEHRVYDKKQYEPALFSVKGATPRIAYNRVDKDELRRLAEKGLTGLQISKKLRTSYSYVYTLARKMDITLRTDKRLIDVAELKRLVSEHKKVKEICEIMGFSEHSIYKNMKKHDMKVVRG